VQKGIRIVARKERVEVRLDGATRRKLDEVASARGASVSEVVRALIERSYEEELVRSRVGAAEELGRMELEDVPEMEVLRRQLEGAHEPRDLR
jgi:hypothetical protein